MAAFFIISTFVIWGMFAATCRWTAYFFPEYNEFHATAWLPVLCTLFVLAGLTLTRHHHSALTSMLYYAAHILLGLAFIAFCVTAGCAILYIFLKSVHVAAREYLGIISLLMLGVLFAYSLWGGFTEPQLKHVNVALPKLPGLKMAVISDAHLGLGVSYKRWDKALTKLESQSPDIVLVLGDLFEYGPDADKYAARLAAFKTPLGTYGVLGNHEYYNNFQAALDFYQKANITLLQNELVTLPNGLQIAGLKDIRTARVTPQETEALLAKANKTAPLILLSHTPLYAEEAAQSGADLMLSGHTHNGQIWPFNYLVKLQFPRVYGLFDVAGMNFYITSGMFYWGVPLRLFAPSELPLVETHA